MANVADPDPVDFGAAAVAVKHNLEFPPFPHKSLDHPIISFADFVPKGIQIRDDPNDADDEADNDTQELDGEGVPTIMLGVIHDLDKDKKKNARPKNTKGAPKTWFEQWADNEILMRATRLDPSQNDPRECLIQADIDFDHGRYFPLPVRALYDEFRVFIGIVQRIEKRRAFERRGPRPSQQPSAPAEAATAPAASNEADEEYFSDDVDEGDDEGEEKPTAPAPFSLPTAPPAQTQADEDGDYNGPLQPLPERADMSAQARVEQFLADPVRGTQCFLSYEFRNRGLYWLEWNLYAGPIIVSAFLDFLVRHELLAPEYRKGLRDAAELAKRAKEELPKTKKAAGALRDGWGTVCAGLWGSREEVHWGVDSKDIPDWAPAPAEDEGYITEVGDAPVAILIEENGQEVPQPSDAELLSDKLGELDINGKPVSIDVADDGSENGAWGAQSEADPVDTAPTWEDTYKPAPSMFSFVGCASFPLTHAPVRAERSVREVLAVNPPMDIFTSTHAKPISLLHSKLGTVVLGPWKGLGVGGPHTEIKGPEMLRVEEARDKDGELLKEKADEFFRPGEPGHVHDPAHDTITVFVDPEVIPNISVGLGIGGIFVQVARRLDAPTFPYSSTPSANNNNTSSDTKTTSSGKKPWTKPHNANSNTTSNTKPNDGRSWWYIDSVEQVIPSYWTDVADLPEVEGLDVEA